MASPSSHQQRVCLARIATAHGVRGAVRLRCFTEQPDDVGAYGPLEDERGERSFDLTIIGHARDGVIAKIAGVTDRDAALALRGRELYVPRERLPEPEPDEFYVHDLIGLDVRDIAGRPFGTVARCENFGAGDLLAIATATGQTVTLPFDRTTVPEVDLEARRLVVDPPAELLELAP